jgi:hypothetical protein
MRTWTVAVAMLAASGCIETHRFAREEAARLEGYHRGARSRTLTDLDQEQVVVGDDTNIVLEDREGQRRGGAFDHITVVDHTFQGETSDGHRVNLALDRVRLLETRRFNPEPLLRTIFVPIGIAGIVVTVAAVLLVGVVVAGSPRFGLSVW